MTLASETVTQFLHRRVGERAEITEADIAALREKANSGDAMVCLYLGKIGRERNGNEE